MKRVQSAGIITWIEEHGTIVYLLLQYGAGHWEFPKGKIEPDETLEQAAQRELYEETKLHATLDEHFLHEFSYIFTNHEGIVVRKQASFFLGKADQQHVVLSHEHRNYLWLPFEQAYTKVTFQNARDILKQAHEHLLQCQG